jgi:anti-sigma B factor antagonist
MTDDSSYHRDIIKDVRYADQAVVLDLAGEIDMKCSVELRNKFIELLKNKPPVLVVNMTEVRFMDSSGLGTLVEALKWCRQNGGQLKLVGMVQSVRNIFEISRLESIFQIYDSEAEALS